MGAEMIDWGWRTALALGLVIVVVLALRAPVRRGFGAGAVLWLWLLLPAAIVATSLPRPAAPAAIVSSTRLPVLDSATAPEGDVGNAAPAPATTIALAAHAMSQPASSRASLAGLFAPIAVDSARASWLLPVWMAGAFALA